MKKSLAGTKKEKSMSSLLDCRVLSREQIEQKSLCNQEKQNQNRQNVSDNRVINQKNKSKKYSVVELSNNSMNSIPGSLFDLLSSLTVLDISNNLLTDKQIEMVMDNSPQLITLNIAGNMTVLIPVSITKLKYLLNLGHDWIKLCEFETAYETVQKVNRIQEVCKKPDIVTKIRKIVGLDFLGYCQYVLDIGMDRELLQKIMRCKCSVFARQNMKRYMQEIFKGKLKEQQKKIIINEGHELIKWPGCFSTNTYQMKKNKKIKKYGCLEIAGKKSEEFLEKQEQSQASTQAHSINIKIQNIRDINQKEENLISTDAGTKNLLPYTSQGMPLHRIFVNFDKNQKSISEIDKLLMKGYNPNQYDSNGLSPYHICVIHNQQKGFQHLLEVSENNPGFFDLQMPSMKQGRNILHYSIFLKNYAFTKMLIQFGFPTEKRDITGGRLVHLVDQNYQFLLLLRKLLKKVYRNFINGNPQKNRRYYIRHPQRMKQQSKFSIVEIRNDKILQMYQSAIGITYSQITKN